MSGHPHPCREYRIGLIEVGWHDTIAMLERLSGQRWSVASGGWACRAHGSDDSPTMSASG